MTTLTNPTPEQLSEAVAVHVAGWENRTGMCENEIITFWEPRIGEYYGTPQIDHPDYARSADAVLPLLEKRRSEGRRIGMEMGFRLWRIWIHEKGPDGLYPSLLERAPDGEYASLPIAACIALLRAHGVEVVFTKTL
jgi:hypothetical protein